MPPTAARPRIVVVGAGSMGAVHARLIAGTAGVTLAGICDQRPTCRRLADELGVPFATKLEDLLQHAAPDAAVIATPNDAHADAVEACASHHVHCLVEKPLADTQGAAGRLVAAAARAGIRVLTGHHRRHSPRIAAARQVIDAGRLGVPVSFAALWLVTKPDAYFADRWRTQRPSGGPVLINLIHELDVMRYLYGEIAEVFAFASSGVRGWEVEDTVAVNVRFASGAIGTICGSDAAAAPWSYELTAAENPRYQPADGDCYYLAGTGGSLALPSLRLWSFPSDAPGGWDRPLSCEALPHEEADPLVRQLAHFVDVVAGATAPLASAEDGARTLAAALAVLESARVRRPVSPTGPAEPS